MKKADIILHSFKKELEQAGIKINQHSHYTAWLNEFFCCLKRAEDRPHAAAIAQKYGRVEFMNYGTSFDLYLGE